jgi:hypothetical protein
MLADDKMAGIGSVKLAVLPRSSRRRTPAPPQARGDRGATATPSAGKQRTHTQITKCTKTDCRLGFAPEQKSPALLLFAEGGDVDRVAPQHFLSGPSHD